MRELLAALWDEHRSISAVLHGLTHLVEDKRARGRALDPNAIRAILYYLDVFPERIHHPKEEKFLFAALQRRTTEIDAVIEVLYREHSAGERAIRELGQLLLRYEQGGEAEFAAFADAVDTYVGQYREHMRTEEQVVMRVAANELSDADWGELRAEWASHRDPLSGIDDRATNERLIARVVALVPPPIGVGKLG